MPPRYRPGQRSASTNPIPTQSSLYHRSEPFTRRDFQSRNHGSSYRNQSRRYAHDNGRPSTPLPPYSRRPVSRRPRSSPVLPSSAAGIRQYHDRLHPVVISLYKDIRASTNRLKAELENLVVNVDELAPNDDHMEWSFNPGTVVYVPVPHPPAPSYQTTSTSIAAAANNTNNTNDPTLKVEAIAPAVTAGSGGHFTDTNPPSYGDTANSRPTTSNVPDTPKQGSGNPSFAHHPTAFGTEAAYYPNKFSTVVSTFVNPTDAAFHHHRQQQQQYQHQPQHQTHQPNPTNSFVPHVQFNIENESIQRTDNDPITWNQYYHQHQQQQQHQRQQQQQNEHIDIRDINVKSHGHSNESNPNHVNDQIRINPHHHHHHHLPDQHQDRYQVQVQEQDRRMSLGNILDRVIGGGGGGGNSSSGTNNDNNDNDNDNDNDIYIRRPASGESNLM